MSHRTRNRTAIARTAWLALLLCGLSLSWMISRAGAQQGGQTTAAVAIDADDIGGVVRGPRGPEAGVWVIAETTDFSVKFRKIVVTDDQGRYVLPDLPKANYQVWVRGYGLVDSSPVKAAPGQQLALTAVPAPDAKAAAHYYPGNYWLSLMQLPPKGAYPMTIPTAPGETSSFWARPRRGVRPRRSRTRPSGSIRSSAAARRAIRWETSRRARCRRASARLIRASPPGSGVCNRVRST
mgnify:CR=1 FL=1